MSTDAKASRLEIARQAVSQFSSRTGRHIEAVTSIEEIDGMWHVGLQVVEDRHIPDTDDLLATYAARLTDQGVLLDFHRTQIFDRASVAAGLRS